MSRLFICDNCGDEFTEPLDQEMHKDEHGEWHTFDLCAPCRTQFNESMYTSKKDFFTKILNQKVKDKQ